LSTVSLRTALVSLFLSISAPFIAPANAYEIYDFGAFLNSPTLGGTSLQYLDSGLNDFAGSGIDISFTNGLDSSSYGDLIWQFTNNTSNILTNVSLFGFVDAEVVENTNHFDNEYGRYVSITGGGNGDINPDSWEIDEPSYIFGDIYYNIMGGALDNTNAIPQGSEDDVSLALGFELGDILVGQTWTMTFTISDTDIGGLYHGDEPSGTGAYLNGTAVVGSTASVPEPASMLLFLIGMSGMTFVRRRRAAQ